MSFREGVFSILMLYLASAGATAANALITTGTNLAFTIYISSSSYFYPLYFFIFFMLFLPDVTVSWDFHSYCICPLLLLSTSTISGWFASSCFSALNLKSHRLLVLFVLNLLQWCLPLGLGDFYSKLDSNVPVYYPSQLVMSLRLCCPS